MKDFDEAGSRRLRQIVWCNVLLFLFLWVCGMIAINAFALLPKLLLDLTHAKELPFSEIITFKTDHLPYYLIAGLLCFGVVLRLAYRSYQSFKSLNQKQKGSRRWTSLKELDREYRTVPEANYKYKGKSGFPISRYQNQIYIDDSPVNNLIIGTTRSGKGEVYIVPAIDINSRAIGINKPSMVITDPKGELAAASRYTLEKRGYAVHILDLLNFSGLSYNPLELIKQTYMRGDIAEAQTLTDTLGHILFSDSSAHDKTWTNWSIALTNALILAIVIDCCSQAQTARSRAEQVEILSKINMYSVVRLLTDLGSSVGDEDDKAKLPIDVFFDSRDDADIAKLQYAAVNYGSSKTKGNIFANTLSVLTKFTMDSIAKMTACNSLDLKDIGFNTERPTAIFLVTPDYDTSKNFLVTMFISQIYFVLAKNASLSPGGKCPREVDFLLDEFGNIPKIPNMESTITVCLGRNIKFTMAIQAYSQLHEKYGKEAAQTIIGNCGNQLYLLTIESQTAEYFSKLIGNETITIQSRSGDPMSLHKGISEHVESKALLNPNELMELTPGESVVVRVTKRQNKRGKSVIPRPIFNHDNTRMKYRYEYLGGAFNTANSYTEIFADYRCLHTNLQPESVCFLSSSKVSFTDKKEKAFPIQETLWQKLSPSLQKEAASLIPESQLPGMEQLTVSEFEAALEQFVHIEGMTESAIGRLQEIVKMALPKVPPPDDLLPNEKPLFPFLGDVEKRSIRLCLPNPEQAKDMSLSDFALVIEAYHIDGVINHGKYEELKRIYSAACNKAGL